MTFFLKSSASRTCLHNVIQQGSECTKFVNIKSCASADAREGYIYINHIERDGA